MNLNSQQNQQQNPNPFTNTRIEFHILQSFPVTCLNRDDVGAPKSAIVGGTMRARVSSQCWKRQVRLAMREFGVKLGTRTKLISDLIKKACIDEGATEEQAKLCGQKIAGIFIKEKEDKKKKPKKGAEDEETTGKEGAAKDNDTLIFISPKEVQLIAQKLKEVSFVPNLLIKQKEQKKQAKELADLIDSDPTPMDAVDIALFGRMVAKAASMNVEAAASFAHAISTHKVNNEVEFFTAMDDESKEQGSAHMGSLEFNSATYYRYISLDLGQLWHTLGGIGFSEAVEAFTKALFLAVPGARQTTQSGASSWEFAKIFVRKGQRLQVPFETAVKQKDDGYLQPSIEYLCSYLDKKEKLAGSLFGKIAAYTFGEDANFSIDDLLTKLKQYASCCASETSGVNV